MKHLRSRHFLVANWIRKYKKSVSLAYSTGKGASIVGMSEVVLDGPGGKSLEGKVQLVFTSPPFPLNTKKKYDNLQGEEYKDWFAGYAERLTKLLTPNGAIVVEIGNAWEPGAPVMSALAIESLLAFKKKANLYLCQEFIWHNPAKLPTPAQWVTIERIRVKDSFTRLWWMSPVEKPKADNRRVLTAYSKSMERLLRTKKYNAGKRPSGHMIGQTSFFTENEGAIPPNVVSIAEKEAAIPGSVLIGSNTANNLDYRQYCEEHGLDPHPARMPIDLARFFIKLCTEPGDLVLDPFAGSNTTGAAAEELDRTWISIEANANYAASGKSRFGTSAHRVTADKDQLDAVAARAPAFLRSEKS